MAVDHLDPYNEPLEERRYGRVSLRFLTFLFVAVFIVLATSMAFAGV